MAALQRFKLLATHCTAAPPPSPSRSPGPPCFRLHKHRRHIIHKKIKSTALRHFISGPDPDPDQDQDPDENPIGEQEKKGLLRDDEKSNTLRDLFVSSPKGKEGGECGGSCGGSGGAGAGVRRGGGGGGWRLMGLRSRLLRRAWRPVLVAIPE